MTTSATLFAGLKSRRPCKKQADTAVRFTKGKSGNPRGRPRGSRNRINQTVRRAIIDALNAVRGATEFFRKMKNSRSSADRVAFVHACARLIPKEIHADIDLGDEAPPIVLYIPRNYRMRGEGGEGDEE